MMRGPHAYPRRQPVMEKDLCRDYRSFDHPGYKRGYRRAFDAQRREAELAVYEYIVEDYVRYKRAKGDVQAHPCRFDASHGRYQRLRKAEKHVGKAYDAEIISTQCDGGGVFGKERDYFVRKDGANRVQQRADHD